MRTPRFILALLVGVSVSVVASATPVFALSWITPAPVAITAGNAANVVAPAGSPGGLAGHTLATNCSWHKTYPYGGTDYEGGTITCSGLHSTPPPVVFGSHSVWAQMKLWCDGSGIGATSMWVTGPGVRPTATAQCPQYYIATLYPQLYWVVYG